jgi:hypothetical protein
MTMKTILYTAGFLAFNYFSLSAIAAEKSIQLDDKMESPVINGKEVAKKFKVSETFVQGGVKYTVYQELEADFSKEPKNDTNKTKNVLKTKGFNIYNISPNENEKRKTFNNKVVINESTDSFGVLSGSIIIKTKNNAVFNDKSFEIVKSYPNLGYYLVRIPKTNKIQDTITKIKNIENVEEVSVEVIENFKEPL